MGALLAWLLSGVATSCFAASFLPNQDDLVTLFSPYDGQVFHPRETVALAAEINWLYWAYLLEFEGRNTFTQLWVSAAIFFAVNVAIIAAIIVLHNNHYEKSKTR